MSGPLAALRVLDLANAPQGWQAGAILADLGAEVVLAEPEAGPLISGDSESVDRGPRFRLAHHRGKRARVFDATSAADGVAMHRLAERADVVIETAPSLWHGGWSLGACDNPRLIRAIASGFGLAGPLANRSANDLTAQAAGGLMHVVGESDGPPLPVGAAVATRVAALLLSYGVLMALMARARSGVGQTVDVSMLGGQILLQSWEITDALLTGRQPPRPGKSHQLSAMVSQIFPTADGHFVLSLSRRADWAVFCQAMGLESALDDPRFATVSARAANRLALMAEIEAVTPQRSTVEWIDTLRALGLDCAPVNRYADLAVDPQVIENDYLPEIEDPTLGRIRTPALPIHYSGTPLGKPGVAPPAARREVPAAGDDWLNDG